MTLAQKIDNFFQNRKSSEKILIYITIFVVTLSLSYEYLLPYSEKFKQHHQSKKEQIEGKIALDKMYIKAMKVNGDEKYYIKFYTKEIENLKDKFKQIAKKKEYLDHKITELSYLLYNKQKWSDFLNSLTQKAAKNGIDISFIQNKFIPATQNFGHVLEIEIGCSGDYKNLISYINDIEQSDLVVDVYQLHMYDSNPIKLIFKVSVWGINF